MFSRKLKKEELLEKQDTSSLVRTTRDFVFELLKVVVISLVIIIPIRFFVIQPFYVKGASMEPSFYDHEYLVIDEISYRFSEPARGDIVVFRYPEDPSQFFIKRIIGLPGEKLEIKDGEVVIYNQDYPSGKILEESYLAEETYTSTTGPSWTALGEDEYFLMGDNRLSSLDSRRFGSVEKKYIVGKTWIRGWPLHKIKYFSSPEYNL